MEYMKLTKLKSVNFSKTSPARTNGDLCPICAICVQSHDLPYSQVF